MEKKYKIVDATPEEVSKFNEGLTKLCTDLGVHVKGVPIYKPTDSGVYVTDAQIAIFHLEEEKEDETAKAD